MLSHFEGVNISHRVKIGIIKLVPSYPRHKHLAFFFILPHLLIALIFFMWPAWEVITQSFFFSDIFGLGRKFANLTNFWDVLKEPDYLKSVWVTIVISISITLVTLATGLLLALLVQRIQKGQGIFKTLLLWPYAVAPAIAAVLWRFLWQPAMGWLTQIFERLGMEFNYLINSKQAILVVILTASWQQFSYNFLFFFVALQTIPKTLIEAAVLDGASSWKRFWQITFPLLSPTTFFLVVINLIYALFDTFSIIDIMTNGGPDNSTSTLTYKIYKDSFWGMDIGSSAAQSVLLMLVVIVLTFIQFHYLEKKVHYE